MFQLSLADIIVYDMATQLRDVFSCDVAADFPEIKALVEKVSSNENIKKYIDSRKWKLSSAFQSRQKQKKVLNIPDWQFFS